MDECREKLESAGISDDQPLSADDVNACELETEHVHKVRYQHIVCAV